VVRRIGTGFEWWEDGGITGVVCVVVVVFSLSLFPSTFPFSLPSFPSPSPYIVSLSLLRRLHSIYFTFRGANNRIEHSSTASKKSRKVKVEFFQLSRRV
jgi:hypothetical protein